MDKQAVPKDTLKTDANTDSNTKYPSTILSQDDLPPREADYAMNKPNRGVAVIISNSHFNESTKRKERCETLCDKELLEDCFKNHLKLEVTCFDDLTCGDMKKRLEEVSKRDFTDYNLFVCAVLTHGDKEGVVYGTDGTLKVADLMTPFKGNNCPTLGWKPKLFFVLTTYEFPRDMVKDTPGNCTSSTDAVKQSYYIPSDADMLLVDAPAYHKDCGEPMTYVKYLVEELKNDRGNREFMQILTRVAGCMHELRPPKDPTVLIPCVTSMLTKNLKLIWTGSLQAT